MSDLSAWPTEDEVLEKFSAKERLAVRRMLAEVRRQAAEEAWERGAVDHYELTDLLDPDEWLVNPYKKAEG